MESCHSDHTAGNLGKTFYTRYQNVSTGLTGACMTGGSCFGMSRERD